MKKMTHLWLLLVAFVLSVQIGRAEIWPAYVYTDANKTLYLIKYDDTTPQPTEWAGNPVTEFLIYKERYTGTDLTEVQKEGSHNLANCANVEVAIVDPALSTYQWKTLYNTFRGCSKLQRIEGLNHIRVDATTRYIDGMFMNCHSLTSLDLSHFNTENVVTMRGLFFDCRSLTSLNLSGWNTGRVSSMHAMFAGCRSLTSLDLSHFVTNILQNMARMFSHCHSLTSLDLSHFKNSSVSPVFYEMFRDCVNLKTLKFHPQRAIRVSLPMVQNMFANTPNLEYIDMSKSTMEGAVLKNMIQSVPNPLTLRYMSKRRELTGPNVILRDTFTNEFTCEEYLLYDDTLTRYEHYLYENVDTITNEIRRSYSDYPTLSSYSHLGFYPRANYSAHMKWEVNIPYAFTAAKVTNNRKIGAKTGSAYTWFMPYSSPIPVGVEVYEFKETTVDGIVATFVPTTDTELKAQKPYLVIATAGEVSTAVDATSEVPVYTPGNDVVAPETSDGWSFVGTFQWRTTEQAAAEGLHTLQTGNKWKHYRGSSVRPRPFRAFLKKVGAGARELSTNFDDGSDITGIEKIELLDSNNPEDSRIYDLNGRYLGTRRDVLTTGTYIIGGKTTRIN